MTITVRAYTEQDASAWDAFCTSGLQATFLHSRRFLSYHGARFDDLSLVIEQDGRCVGLLPAARHPGEHATVVSHPGSTFGGVVHQGDLRGEAMLAALRAAARHYRGQGLATLLYKAVPAFYHRVPAQDDLYALFRLGARRTRCDLSSTIDLEARRPPGSRRRRSLAKAVKAGVRVESGIGLLEPLWRVLADNLARKHGVKPVHTLEEITYLAQALPDQIRCVCALHDDTVIAGVVLFVSATTLHAQYIAASEAGYLHSALDPVFEACIAQAAQEGRRWFDFGISTEAGGTLLNESLYQFKSEFGGGGAVHEFYEITLEED